MKAAILPLTAVAVVMLCQGAPLAPARADTIDVEAPYPTEVALVEEGSKGYVYRRFPSRQRLYTYDKDLPNQSVCNIGCDGARTPVYAPKDAHTIGDWTVLTRYDGLKQWVYKGKPVYTLYHDIPEDPQGDGEDGLWHLLPYMQPTPGTKPPA